MKNLSEKIQESFNEQRNISDRQIEKTVDNAMQELRNAPLEDSLDNSNRQISFFIDNGKIDYDIVPKNIMPSKEHIYSMDYAIPNNPGTERAMKDSGLDYNDEEERREWEWNNFTFDIHKKIDYISDEIKIELKRRDDEGI